MNTVVQLKKCLRCGQTKPATLEYFYSQKNGKYGFRSPCKLCIGINNNAPIAVKPKDHTHRNENIYRTYYKTTCDNPTKKQMLAQFYDISVSELNKIIKTEDEKMAYRKWTDADNEQLLSLADIGKTKEELAVMFGTSPHNIENRILKLRKAQKPTSDPTPNEIVDPVATYGDTELIQEEPVKAATINEEFEALFPIPAKPAPGVNAKIRELCETPEPPKPKPDFTESLIETLREHLEDNNTTINRLYHDFAEIDDKNMDLDFELRDLRPDKPKVKSALKQRTVFDEAHAVLWSLESFAKKNNVLPIDIVLKINSQRIIAETGSLEYGMISINKKNPLAGTAIPTSGEA